MACCESQPHCNHDPLNFIFHPVTFFIRREWAALLHPAFNFDSNLAKIEQTTKHSERKALNFNIWLQTQVQGASLFIYIGLHLAPTVMPECSQSYAAFQAIECAAFTARCQNSQTICISQTCCFACTSTSRMVLRCFLHLPDIHSLSDAGICRGCGCSNPRSSHTAPCPVVCGVPASSRAHICRRTPLC